MPSERLRSSLLRDYDSAGESELIRAFLELRMDDATLWKIIDLDALTNVLREPRKESDLRRPVKDYLTEQWGLDRIAADVPLHPRSSRSTAKADVIGYKKKLLGGRQAYAVELASSVARGAVRQAFVQATEYQRTCEYTTVCVSPLVYMNYLEDLDRELKQEAHRGLGVWVANAERVLFEIRKPTLFDASGVDREVLFDWIAGHEY